MENIIPWAELAQLGVGGMFAIILLLITFRFLSNRKNEMEQIILKMDASEDKMARAMSSIAKAIENQTTLIEKVYDKQNQNYIDLLKEFNNGPVSRRINKMS